MKLDKEEHRGFLLEVLDAINVPGRAVDLFLEVREGLKAACVDCDCECSTPDSSD